MRKNANVKIIHTACRNHLNLRIAYLFICIIHSYFNAYMQRLYPPVNRITCKQQALHN